MTYNELAPGVWIFDNIFTDAMDMINQIESEDVSWESSMVFSKEENKKIQTEHRNSFTIGLPMENSRVPGDKRTDFYDKFKSSIQDPVRLYSENFELRLVENEPTSIIKYNPGNYFVKHADSNGNLHRTLSLVYYANDNYEGGELIFDRWKVSIKPKRNQLVLFPSNFMYTHEVKPVISGTRYSVVSWLI